MQIEIGARTDMGRVRSNNEDNYKVAPEIKLFVLSDGMGGEAHGEVASKIAVEAIVAHCLDAAKQPSMPLLGDPVPDVSPQANRLVSAVRLANRMIYESSQKHPAQRGMGATIVAAWVQGERLCIAHVGDSRAYLLRSGELQQLTQDHSLVAEQVRRGVLSPQQADESEMQSVLIRALGIEENVQVDADEHLLMDGDTILLCSDGLNRMVTDPEIASTLLIYVSVQSATNRLVELANENGGPDNITIVAFRVRMEPDGFLARAWRWLSRPMGSTSSEGGN